MKLLLKEIDLIIDQIKNDATRSGIVGLWVKLIELSKMYAEAKQDYTRLKNKYENEFVMEKESFRWYFEDINNREYTKELETNPKAKKWKTTNVECETQAELKLIGLKREIEEPQLTMIYLEPLIRSYYEFINLVKFQDRETIKLDQQLKTPEILPF